MHSKNDEVCNYTAEEARNKFKDLIDTVTYTRQPAIVTKHGDKKVAVIPYDYLELFTHLEAIIDVEKARQVFHDFEKSGGVTLEELKKELKID